jgi:hypothetical protein
MARGVYAARKPGSAVVRDSRNAWDVAFSASRNDVGPIVDCKCDGSLMFYRSCDDEVEVVE